MLSIKKILIFALTFIAFNGMTPTLSARSANRGNGRSAQKTSGNRSKNGQGRAYQNRENGRNLYGPAIAAGFIGSAAATQAGDYEGNYYPVNDEDEDTTHAEQIADDENQNYELHESYLG